MLRPGLKVSGRPDFPLAVSEATAGYATSVHAVAVDPESPRKNFGLTLSAGIVLQCLEEKCSDEFIGQRLSLEPCSPVSSLMICSLSNVTFLLLHILKGPHTHLFVHDLSGTYFSE